jgi:membrane protein
MPSHMTTTGQAARGLGENDRPPDSPPEISGSGWKAAFKRATKKSKADRVPMMAGSITYHSFLGLFPALIALIGVMQLIGVSTSFVTKLINGLGKALPAGASSVFATALEAAHKRTSGALGVTIIAIAVSLWSSSSATAAVETGLDVAYEVPVERKFLRKRAVAIALLVVLAVFGGVAAALIVFAAPLGNLIQHHIGLSHSVFIPVWTAVRWVATVLVLVLLMAIVYRLAPNRPSPSFKWLSVGGVFATIVWLVASLALSFYVSSFGSYSKTYGALAGVAVLLLWFYITAYAVLFGGQLNAELERQAVIEGGSTTVSRRQSG